MRKELEGIGDTKKWLLSKERTPLEEQRLRLMDHKEPCLEQVIKMSLFVLKKL